MTVHDIPSIICGLALVLWIWCGLRLFIDGGTQAWTARVRRRGRP